MPLTLNCIVCDINNLYFYYQKEGKRNSLGEKDISAIPIC